MSKNKLQPIKEKDVRRPGIEPGSIAWKATMLTFTPPTLHWLWVSSLQGDRYIFRLPANSQAIHLYPEVVNRKHIFFVFEDVFQFYKTKISQSRRNGKGFRPAIKTR